MSALKAASLRVLRPDVAAAVDLAVLVSFDFSREIEDQRQIDLSTSIRYAFLDLECDRCGCTDDRACLGGCSWVSLAPPVCSRCT